MRRKLDAPTRYEEQPSDLALKRAYRFGDGGLGERKSLRGFSEMQVRSDRKEAIDLPQVHAALRLPIDRPRQSYSSLRFLTGLGKIGFGSARKGCPAGAKCRRMENAPVGAAKIPSR